MTKDEIYQARIAELETTLAEIRWMIEGYVDVKDGAQGPIPNNAMLAVRLIDEALTLGNKLRGYAANAEGVPS